jgi:hypothetical protein
MFLPKLSGFLFIALCICGVMAHLFTFKNDSCPMESKYMMPTHIIFIIVGNYRFFDASTPFHLSLKKNKLIIDYRLKVENTPP